MNRPIRLMNVISRLNIGGISGYVIALTGRLPNPPFGNYETRLVAGSLGKREGDMSYLADEAGVKTRLLSLPSLGREISPLRDMATVRDLYRLIRREKPDIVHTHTAKAGFVGRVAARLAGVPLVFHSYHGHVFAGYFGRTKTRFYLALEQLGAALSTRIITVTEGLKRDLGEKYHVARPDKIAVVAAGYELRSLYDLQRGQNPSLRDQFNIPREAPLVGIVGRLVPIKNHALFLEAARIVHETLPEAHFAIIGDGELRAELEKQTGPLGLAGCVHFTSWITDLTAIYGTLDAMALTSKNEGLPSSVIEALVTGVPIVATAVGGVVDMLPEGMGALVPPGDAQAVARALIAVLTDPVVRAQAESNRREAFAFYDMDAATGRIDAFYKRILAEK